MDLDQIRKNTERLLQEIPEGVIVVAAAKSRTPQEVLAAIEGGIRIVGHNYVKEAEAHREILKDVEMHMIGHLQTNKARKAAKLFGVIQTLDSIKLAQELERVGQKEGIAISVLVEVNSAREPQKSGVLPEDLKAFLERLSPFQHLLVRGLMTMGPLRGDPEEMRPYFRLTKELFDELQGINSPNVRMEILSMGMSDSYTIAIEEGANMVRIGTRIFGPRY
ncbi:MAG: YggS family pyridoxal phosphate-dependent enzyme [Desulfatiglandales bacterium]